MIYNLIIISLLYLQGVINMKRMTTSSMREASGGKKKYRCDDCGKKFSTNVTLGWHLLWNWHTSWSEI